MLTLSETGSVGIFNDKADVLDLDEVRPANSLFGRKVIERTISIFIVN